MKRLFVLTVFGCLSLSLSSRRIAGSEPEVRRIDESLPGPGLQARDMGYIAEEWKNACNAGDAAKVAALYCEEGYYLSAHILVQGRDAIQA